MRYPTVPSPTPYGHLFFQNKGPDPQNLQGMWHVFGGIAGSLRNIATYVSKQETTFTFAGLQVQAGTVSSP